MVSTWVLIITLSGMANHNDGPAMDSTVQSVSGFNSESGCLRAALVYKNNTALHRYFTLSTVCVNLGG